MLRKRWQVPLGLVALLLSALYARGDLQEAIGEAPSLVHSHQRPQRAEVERRPVEVLSNGARERMVVPGELLLGFGPGASLLEIEANLGQGYAVADWIPQLGAARLRLPEGTSVAEGMEQLRALPGFPEPQPNSLVVGANVLAFAAAVETEVAPAAPTTGELEQVLEKVIKEAEEADKLVENLEKAEEEGYPVVAILDTGVAWRSALLERGAYRRQDDLKDIAVRPGWDFVHEDADALDDNSHGTHMASVISKAASEKLQLMPIKVLDRNAMGSEFDVARGLLFAVENGAQIVNLSLSFGPNYVPSDLMAEAINLAGQAGVLLVGAAGNDGAPYVSYPAALRDVIAVGAAGEGQSAAAGFSNTGSALDLVTDGGRVPQDEHGVKAHAFVPGRPVEPKEIRLTGTSVAAARASGLLARLVFENGDVEPQLLKRALLYSAEEFVNPDASLSGYGALHYGDANALASDLDEVDLAALMASPRRFVAITTFVEAVSAHTSGAATGLAIGAGEDQDLRVAYAIDGEPGEAAQTVELVAHPSVKLAEVELEVKIEHLDLDLLQVALRSPEGVEVPVYDRSESNGDKLERHFVVPAWGLTAGGTWTLLVRSFEECPEDKRDKDECDRSNAELKHWHLSARPTPGASPLEGERPELRGVAVVEVTDDERQPLAGAEVFGDWMGSVPGSARCVSDAYGRCVMQTGLIQAPESGPMPLLFALSVRRVRSADGLVSDPLPATRLEGAQAQGLADELRRVVWSKPAAEIDAVDLATIDSAEPGAEQLCIGSDCPGWGEDLGAAEDLYEVRYLRKILMSRVAAAAPGPESLLAGRALQASWFYRGLGRAGQGADLAVAMSEDFVAQLDLGPDGDFMELSEGLRLGSQGPGAPLLWVNDLSADTLAEGAGLWASGWTTQTFDLSYWGAGTFYADTTGSGMMGSTFTLGYSNPELFWLENSSVYGDSWSGFGAGLWASGWSTFTFFNYGFEGL